MGNRNHVTRLLTGRDGTTAIETAFILPIFFAMVFATFEVGNVFFKQSVVEQAVHAAARQVRVGQALSSSYVNDDAQNGECATGRECFYDDVCRRVSFFGSCEDNLSIEVRQFADFEALVAAGGDAMTCPNDPGYVIDAQPYEPGLRNEVIRVRICYTVKTFNPAVGINLRQNGDNTRSIVAVAIHRNEPFLDDDDINPNAGL